MQFQHKNRHSLCLQTLCKWLSIYSRKRILHNTTILR